MLRKVYLEGEIAEKFGSEFEMNVSSFQEALQCFELNFQEFREYMWSCHERGIGFICSVEGESIDKDEKLLVEYPEGSFTIQAIPVGSKSGFMKILLAAVLITVAVMNPGLGSTVLTMAGGTEVGAITLGLALMGTSLAMAGLQQIMAPDPSVDVDNRQDESYLFQGSAQTAKEGDPVPVLYGKLRIPGRPISFEIKGENRAFMDYAQPGEDFVVPDSGDQPDTGPDYDYDRERDHDGNQGFSQ